MIKIPHKSRLDDSQVQDPSQAAAWQIRTDPNFCQREKYFSGFYWQFHDVGCIFT